MQQAVEGVYTLARWLNWIEHKTTNLEVVGSTPTRVTFVCVEQLDGSLVYETSAHKWGM